VKNFCGIFTICYIYIKYSNIGRNYKHVFYLIQLELHVFYFNTKFAMFSSCHFENFLQIFIICCIYINVQIISCTQTHLYTHPYTHTHPHTHTHTNPHTHTHTHPHKYVCVCLCLSECVCVCGCVGVWAWICTHTHTLNISMLCIYTLAILSLPYFLKIMITLLFPNFHNLFYLNWMIKCSLEFFYIFCKNWFDFKQDTAAAAYICSKLRSYLTKQACLWRQKCWHSSGILLFTLDKANGG